MNPTPAGSPERARLAVPTPALADGPAPFGGASSGTPLQLPTPARGPIAPSLPAPVIPAVTTHSTLAITGLQRAQYRAFSVLWIASAGAFWAWWLAEHARPEPTFLLAAATMAYLTTVLPSFYWYFVGRARVPARRPAPRGLRVAVITPCVPASESSDVVAAQLAALAQLDYPCDVWLLDEGDDPELAALCLQYGARHFSRKGRAEWNQPAPPFKAKTKAGNVNAWIDHVGRRGLDYDVFVQFDIDHRPHADYLDTVLGHFSDPQIGWVQAPSVSGNLEYWTARGQAEQETALQGPLQMGFYGHSGTPFIIGSHTSYRMSAIREIGGYQPTRAEDHLDTVVLAAHGYRGIYVLEVIAVGDGPTTFGTYLGQQFAWAYSMAQILLHHTPRLLRRYTRQQAFQFLMAQSWYTLWSFACAALWALPLVALVTGSAIAPVRPSDFAVHYLPVVLVATAMWWWTRNLFQPRRVRWSWRWLILEAARWPIVLWAIVNAVLRIERPYMITPKGSRASNVVPGLRLYAPYLLLTWLAVGAIAVFVERGAPEPTAGYLWLALLNAAGSMAVLLVAGGAEANQILHEHGARVLLRARLATAVVVGPTMASVIGAAVAVGPQLAAALQ